RPAPAVRAHGLRRLVRGVPGWRLAHVRSTQQRAARRAHPDRARARRRRRRDHHHFRPEHAQGLPRLDRRDLAQINRLPNLIARAAFARSWATLSTSPASQGVLVTLSMTTPWLGIDDAVYEPLNVPR